MIEAVLANIIKARRAKTYTIQHLEITQSKYFKANEVFLCHTHQSVGVPTGYVSDDEIIARNHVPSDMIFTENTGTMEFFGVNPTAIGYLIKISEYEEEKKEKLEIQLVTNQKDQITEIKAYGS